MSPTFSSKTPLDRAIADRATARHGVVEIRQLTQLGPSASGVRSRVAAGRLHRIVRNVCAVERPAIDQKGRWMAALMACGPGAVLSHRSAAALRQLRCSCRRIVGGSSARRVRRSREGIDSHSAATLEPIDVVEVDAIPCTSVARTLLDIAEVAGRRDVERACDQAEVLRIFDLRAIEDVLARANGRRGAPILEAIITAS